MDSATRTAIANPPTGLMVFQLGTTTPRTRTGFYYFAGGTWLYLPDKASSGDNLGNGQATTNVVLNNKALLLRDATDNYHGLQYSSTYDGPSLYGYNGGALGFGQGGSTPALRWDNTGLVGVPDRLGVGTSGTNSGLGPDLLFGGIGTGEGIGSARSRGNPNQYGLDFYTNFTKRLSISGEGNVGVGTPAPSSTLKVEGSFAVGVADNVAGSSSGYTELDKAGYYGLAPTSSSAAYRLPDPAACPGRVYYVRNNSGSPNAVLYTNGSGRFVYSSSQTIFYALAGYSTATIISTGTNWAVFL